MSRENTEFSTNENTQIMTDESEMLNSPMISIEKVGIIYDQIKRICL